MSWKVLFVCGAVEYISKPFDSEELLEKIKKILGENV